MDTLKVYVIYREYINANRYYNLKYYSHNN